MTPTSEERRDVAEMLRIEVREEETSLDYPVCRIINDVLGVNGAWGDKAARILADMIDPTCEVDSIEPVEDELGQTVSYEFNLTCGHSVTKPYIEAPAYCDVCGARVVSEDDE